MDTAPYTRRVRYSPRRLRELHRRLWPAPCIVCAAPLSTAAPRCWQCGWQPYAEPCEAMAEQPLE